MMDSEIRYLDESWQQDTSKNRKNLRGGDPLAIVYNEGVWRLNKVSPLFNLQYMPVKLKMFASKVRNAIVSAVQASLVKYAVTFEELPNLKYSGDDPSGLMITVSSTLGNGKKKEVYVAILLSWGMSLHISKATHLPYMLERGEQRVGTAVKSMLQALFDCNIAPFKFTQNHLLQFGFNFAEHDMSRGTDQFILTYKTPDIDYKEKLQLKFDVEDINIIWNGIKEDNMSQSELITQAYKVLQSLIFDMVKLDIVVFDLSGIHLPKAEIKCNGEVKMKTPELVNSVFIVLNEISNMKIGDEINYSK